MRAAPFEATNADASEVVVHAAALTAKPERALLTRLGHPLATGFLLVLGGLLAVVLGRSLAAAATVGVYVVMALFLALGLEPLIRGLTARGLSRGRAVGLALGGVGAVLVALILLVVPTIVKQVAAFIHSLPGLIQSFMQSSTYAWIQDTLGFDMGSLLHEAQVFLSDPGHLATLGGGALQVGSSIAGGVTGLVIVLVLTLYFVTGLPAMKESLLRLAPARNRAKASDVAGQIMDSTGGYVGGMVLLAAINGSFVALLSLVLGLSFPLLMGVAAMCITLIPMVGSVLFWMIGTFAALLVSPVAAIVFALAYLVYVQVEAYVLTPKVMNKAVAVPGVLVVISAVAGGTLLGLLGAFIAIPVTAAVLILLKELWLPRQDRKI